MKMRIVLGLLGLVASVVMSYAQKVETLDTTSLSWPNEVREPYGVAVDIASGLYYFTDYNNRVIVHNPERKTTGVIAVNFLDPRGIILARGGLVVADAGNHVVRRVSLGGAVTEIAGVLGEPGSTNAATAHFNAPTGLAVDAAGRIYVADQLNNAIRIINTDNTVVNLAVANTTFFRPSAVALDESRNLIFVADTGNRAVKVISGGVMLASYEGYDSPRGLLWVGGETGLLVADSGSQIITSIGGSFYAGSYRKPGPYGDDGPGPAPTPIDGNLTEAQFNSPVGLAIDAQSSIIVADLYTYALRRITRRVLTRDEEPTMSLAGGSFSNAVTVTFQSKLPSMRFHFSTDAEEPATVTSPQGTSVTISNGPTVLSVLGASPDTQPSRVISNLFQFFVHDPVLTPKGRTNANDVLVTLSSRTDGAEFYYTVDGSEPSKSETSTNGNFYTGSVVVTQSGELKVRGFKEGYSASVISAAPFRLTNAVPVLAPAGGTFSNAVAVTLRSGTTNALMVYTTDGSTPDPLRHPSVTNGAAAVVDGIGLLRVAGVREGYFSSLVVSNVFSFVAADPTINPDGGTNNNAPLITLESATTNAVLRWTLDGSEPSATNGSVYRGAFKLPSQGLLKAVALKDGYAASEVESSRFVLEVEKPTITPLGATNNAPVEVTLTSGTTNAVLVWTIDGSEPALTNGTLYGGAPFLLATNGQLQVKGFQTGFTPSLMATAMFRLQVNPPTVAPAGATNSDVVTVTISDIESGSQAYWTIDNSEPTTNSFLYAAPFTLATNGVLKVRAHRNGFLPSVTVTNDFRLQVAAPVVTPAGISTNDSVQVSMSTTTPSADLHWTYNGAEPTTSSAKYTAPIILGTNGTLKVKGFRKGFLASETVTNEFKVRIDSPVLTPAYGYFPDGTDVSITVSNANAKIYYRLDGQTPTTNDTLYAGPIRLNDLNFHDRDLRALAVVAIAPNLQESEIVTGQAPRTNEVRISRDVTGGPGSRVVVPVVVSLKTNVVLRSLQFRVHIAPASNSVPILISALTTVGDLNPVLDFIHVGVSGEDPAKLLVGTHSSYTTPGPAPIVTNVLSVAYVGTNSNYRGENFGIAAMLAVPIPPSAKEGDTYRIEIVQPSATSDGEQIPVEVFAGEARHIRVKSTAYTVGDSAMGAWYNAGDYGNGNLNNNDVNNAFYASIGLRVPFIFTDLFDAMDAFPIDTLDRAGGDGQIRFLDWQHILERSLRRETNNWQRTWSVDGIRVPAGATLNNAANLPAESQTVTDSTVRWFRPASIAGAALENATAGQAAHVPVYVNVKPGYSVAGLQFRATVKPVDTAPRLSRPVEFVPASGMPAPSFSVAAATADGVGCGWSIGAFSRPLTGERNLIGHVRLVVPASSAEGQAYALQFDNVDGAPDLYTQYDFESFPGEVWVASAAATGPASISDEWKRHFFGEAGNAHAAADEDPDGDGISNQAEFAAGTDPVELRLRGTEVRNGALFSGLKLTWYGASGKVYDLEGSEDLESWTPVVTIVGQADLEERSVGLSGTRFKFYRVRSQ